MPPGPPAPNQGDSHDCERTSSGSSRQRASCGEDWPPRLHERSGGPRSLHGHRQPARRPGNPEARGAAQSGNGRRRHIRNPRPQPVSERDRHRTYPCPFRPAYRYRPRRRDRERAGRGVLPECRWECLEDKGTLGGDLPRRLAAPGARRRLQLQVHPGSGNQVAGRKGAHLPAAAKRSGSGRHDGGARARSTDCDAAGRAEQPCHLHVQGRHQGLRATHRDRGVQVRKVDARRAQPLLTPRRLLAQRPASSRRTRDHRHRRRVRPRQCIGGGTDRRARPSGPEARESGGGQSEPRDAEQALGRLHVPVHVCRRPAIRRPDGPRSDAPARGSPADRGQCLARFRARRQRLVELVRLRLRQRTAPESARSREGPGPAQEGGTRESQHQPCHIGRSGRYGGFVDADCRASQTGGGHGQHRQGARRSVLVDPLSPDAIWLHALGGIVHWIPRLHRE